MARFRFARPAQADLADILSTSAERWGVEGRRRYAAVLVAAIRKVAVEPRGPLTRARPELRRDIRSFHVRHARHAVEPATVKRPVHVLYYRVARDGTVEILRLLHEHMDPSRHLDQG